MGGKAIEELCRSFVVTGQARSRLGTIRKMAVHARCFAAEAALHDAFSGRRFLPMQRSFVVTAQARHALPRGTIRRMAGGAREMLRG